MDIKYNLNGINLKDTPTQIATSLKAVPLSNRTWWLPYNKTTLEKLTRIFSLTTAKWHLDKYQKIKPIPVDRTNYPHLRDYQYEDLCKIINMKNHVNFSEMRTGKTVTTLAWANETGLNKGVVVAPKSVIVLTWEQEIKKWLPNAIIYKAYSYTGSLSVKKREQVYKDFINDKRLCFLLVSKDTIKKDVKDITILNHSGKKIANPNFKMNLLGKRLSDYLLILDEATFLKNFKTQQTKVLKIVSNYAEYTSCLTGTPTPKHPINIYSIMHIINSKIFHSYYNLANYYFGVDYWGSVIETFKSPELRQEWIDWLSEFGVRHTQKEVMNWLPEIERLNIGVDLDKEQLKKYNDMKNKFTDEDGIRIPNVISQFTKLKVIANSPYGTKKDFVLEYLDSNEEESIMIVSRYTEKVLKPLQKILKDSGIQAELLIGSTSLNDRIKIVNKVNNKEIKVLLANRICIKEGIKLPGIDTLIWFDKGSTADNSQVESRFLPTTAEEKVNSKRIISLITFETVDEKSENELVVANELNSYLEEWNNL